MTVLGVDIGTTSAKAAAFAPDGEVLARAERAYELREPQPGWAVQDPGEVVAAVRAAIGDVDADVRALAFSGAMHSLVGVDAGGRPLTDLVTWADTRASEQAETLRRADPELHARTGTPLHPMSPLAKLCWFREHEPETFGRVERWCGIKELVLHELTGEWVIDHSCASGTGLFSLRDEGWDARALELAGVAPEQLSRPVPCTELLDGAPPLVVGGGDGPLANLGVGAVAPGVAACSIGTSGALRVVVEEPAVDPEGRVFCYALAPGRWVVGGAINNGGVVLQWAGDALAPDLGDHPEQELLALAEQAPPGSDGLVMLPYLLSERAPHWSPLPTGAYVGLTRHHGRPHLIRAALEGVCQQLAVVLESVRDAGNEVHEVRATGGFARSPFWRRLLADALGMPVGFPASHEGSGFGAALLGMEALGEVGSIDRAAELVEIEEVVEPDPESSAVLAHARPVFTELYDALAPTFRHLRGLQ